MNKQISLKDHETNNMRDQMNTTGTEKGIAF